MQAVFKPVHAPSFSSNPSKVKLAVSKHTPVFCLYCEKVNLPGEESFKTCSGCRTVRYCSREHQAKHWPEHKAICQSQTALIPSSSLTPDATHTHTLPTIPQRTQIEDFVRLHHHILSRVLSTAISSGSSSPQSSTHSPKPKINSKFDFKRQMAIITLSPRPQTESTNPARAFSLVRIHFEAIPSAGTEMGDKIAPLLRGMEIADSEDRRTNPDYFGLLLCDYQIPEWRLHWTSPRSLFFSDLYATPNADWWKVAKFYLDTGIVYRLVPQEEKGQLCWKPGTLVRSKRNWVWQKGNFDVVRKELEAAGGL